MGASAIQVAGSFAAPDNGTYNLPLIGTLFRNSAIDQTEAYVKIPIRTAGTFQNLRVKVPTNTASVNSTFTLRIDGANSALTIPIGSDVTTPGTDLADLAHTVHVDGVATVANYQLVVPSEAGTNTLTLTDATIEFVPDDPTLTVQILGVTANGPNLNSASTNRFAAMGGRLVYSATVAPTKYRARSTFTTSHFYGYAVSNARTNDTIFTVQVGGSNVNQTFTVNATGGAQSTGAFEDTTHSDNCVSGNDLNMAAATGTGTESLVMSVLCLQIVSTDGTVPYCSGLASGQANGPATTFYYGIQSGVVTGSTTEANITTTVVTGFTASDLFAYVTADTDAVTAATITIYKNGAPTGILITVPTLASAGLKSETTPTTVAFVGGDTISIEVANPDAAGTLTFSWFGFLAAMVSGGAVPVMMNLRRQMRD